MAKREISLAAFYLIWAKRKNWKVPAVHLEACDWLENRGDLAVFRAHRGFSKSTLLAIYNAWRYYTDPTYRILHQSEADPTAYKTSRDTQTVLKNHPLTRGMFRGGGVREWWVEGSIDPRNANMSAIGILSNVTSARADECQNDDVEVPRNIQTPEAREKLRARLDEQTHILVPGGRTLYVGTPHTHDSLYDEQEAMGADCLTIRMFEHEHRIENATRAAYELPFVPEFVFYGIFKMAKLLQEGRDYKLQGRRLVFAAAPGGLVDCYAGVAWPERFDGAELLKRRRKTRTINAWDSQYQLHSKPVHETRLDPRRLKVYNVEPRFVVQNRVLTCWLGEVQIVGMTLRWDPSSGKAHTDKSAVVLDLQDRAGRHYWHRVTALEGEIAVTDKTGKKITEGQVLQLVELIRAFKVPRTTIETNGIGKYAPAFLKMALKQQGVSCGVKEIDAVANKEKRILEALEPLIQAGMLWVHQSVVEGDLWDQMLDWNPAVKNQEDDLLDAGAGAVTDQPALVGSQTFGISNDEAGEDWRPPAQTTDYELE